MPLLGVRLLYRPSLLWHPKMSIIFGHRHMSDADKNKSSSRRLRRSSGSAALLNAGGGQTRPMCAAFPEDTASLRESGRTTHLTGSGIQQRAHPAQPLRNSLGVEFCAAAFGSSSPCEPGCPWRRIQMSLARHAPCSRLGWLRRGKHAFWERYLHAHRQVSPPTLLPTTKAQDPPGHTTRRRKTFVSDERDLVGAHREVQTYVNACPGGITTPDQPHAVAAMNGRPPPSRQQKHPPTQAGKPGA